jgi:salicylate 5-hydroxylase small subunit
MSNDLTPLSLPSLERLLLQQRIDAFNAHYAEVLDARRFDEWPLCFVETGRYQLQARENFDRGLPLSLMDLESQGMMKDRVFGVTQTIFHAPYYTRHVVGVASVLGQRVGDSGTSAYVCEASYAVFRTKPGQTSEVFNVGRYRDELVETPEGLRLRWRRCIYDTELVLNSLIYPI